MGRVGHVRYRMIRRRMRRTLGYGQFCNMDQLSLPCTEAATCYFDGASPFDYLDGEFAARLSRHACVDPSCLVLALVYLERLRAADRQYFECTDPAHLYLSALMVANKYLHDDGESDFVYNDEWAACCQLDKQAVNALELEMLKRLDWKILVERWEYDRTLEQLESTVCAQQFEKGYSTYAQLQVLLNWNTIYEHMIRPLCMMLGVACVTYTCGLAAIVITAHHRFFPAEKEAATPAGCAGGEPISSAYSACATHSPPTHGTRWSPAAGEHGHSPTGRPGAHCCEPVPSLAAPIDPTAGDSYTVARVAPAPRRGHNALARDYARRDGDGGRSAWDPFDAVDAVPPPGPSAAPRSNATMPRLGLLDESLASYFAGPIVMRARCVGPV